MGDSAADAGGEALIQRVADHFFDDDFQSRVMMMAVRVYVWLLLV